MRHVPRVPGRGTPALSRGGHPQFPPQHCTQAPRVSPHIPPSKSLPNAERTSTAQRSVDETSGRVHKSPARCGDSWCTWIGLGIILFSRPLFLHHGALSCVDPAGCGRRLARLPSPRQNPAPYATGHPHAKVGRRSPQPPLAQPNPSHDRPKPTPHFGVKTEAESFVDAPLRTSLVRVVRWSPWPLIARPSPAEGLPLRWGAVVGAPGNLVGAKCRLSFRLVSERGDAKIVFELCVAM